MMKTSNNNCRLSGLRRIIPAVLSAIFCVILTPGAIAAPAVVIQDGIAFKKHSECSDYMQVCAQLRDTYGPANNSEKTRAELIFLNKKYLKTGRAVKVKKGQ